MQLSRYGPDKALAILRDGIARDWATVDIPKWAALIDEPTGKPNATKSKLAAIREREGVK
jgi:hypothetical protein